MRARDVKFLLGFNARTAMYVGAENCETITSYLHGYKAGTDGKCRFVEMLSDRLENHYGIKKSSGSWPYQIKVLAHQMAIDWVSAYHHISDEILRAAQAKKRRRGGTSGK